MASIKAKAARSVSVEFFSAATSVVIGTFVGRFVAQQASQMYNFPYSDSVYAYGTGVVVASLHNSTFALNVALGSTAYGLENAVQETAEMI